jgi:hypothetical protein
MRALLTTTAIAIFVCAPLASYAQEHSAQGGQSVPPPTAADQDKSKSTTASAGTQTPQTPAAQSSLGDLARKTREEKKATKPVKVFTNDNIPTSGGLSLAGASAANSDKPGGEASASTGTGTSAPSRDTREKEWRDKFAKLRQKLATDKENLDVMQRELGTLSLQYYPDPNKAMQQQLSRDDINKKTADIEAKKKEIAADQQAIDDAEDDLRKAGGDPGWAR